MPTDCQARAICTKYGGKLHSAPSFVALTFLLRGQVSGHVLCLLGHLWDRHGSNPTFLLVPFVRGHLFMPWGFNQQESPSGFHSLLHYTLFGVWYLTVPRVVIVTQTRDCHFLDLQFSLTSPDYHLWSVLDHRGFSWWFFYLSMSDKT